jgi:hypothetical protein
MKRERERREEKRRVLGFGSGGSGSGGFKAEGGEELMWVQVLKRLLQMGNFDGCGIEKSTFCLR